MALANERHASGVTAHAYAVAHVDIARVAKVSCVSRTALYRLWETQESFRADLAAYLAARDEAPWMELSGRRFGRPLAYPDELFDLVRERLNADQERFAADPRPLLRAGIASYPNANAVTAVIAGRELWRLSRHAEVVGRALRSTGRRCRDGLVPLDISVVTACMADGLALAARMLPPQFPLTAQGATPAITQPLPAGRPQLEASDAGSAERPWSLFALAACALFDGMSEPHPAGEAPAEAGPRAPGATGPPAGEPSEEEPRGRRRDYLQVAAELVSAEPSGEELTDSYAVGYIGLDALARAGGVTRAAVRKLWPTQAAFRLDLFVHLLSRHRQLVSERLRQVTREAPPSGQLSCWERGPHGRGSCRLHHALLQAGDELSQQLLGERSQVSHLTFAPQFVLPSFRSHIHRHMGPLLEVSAAPLAELLSTTGHRPRSGLTEPQVVVLAHALLDGMGRVSRTIPEVAQRPIRYQGASHTLLGVALANLLCGL